jgi:hypothetical protein
MREPLLWNSKVPLPYLQEFYSARYPEWMYTSFASTEPRTITEFVPAECLCSVSIKRVLTYDMLPFVISDPYPLKTKELNASTFLSSAPRVTKEHYFLKSSLASPSCPSRAKYRRSWMRSIDRKILTRESRRAGRTTCPTATLSASQFVQSSEHSVTIT